MDSYGAYNMLNIGHKMYQANVNSNMTNKFDPELHEENIQRRIDERNNLFNMDTRNNRFLDKKNMEHDQKFSDSKNVGEITGSNMELHNLEHGMPMRTFINEKEQVEIKNRLSQLDSYNPQLDFDLYESKPKTNVSYFDPLGSLNTNITSFSDINGPNKLLTPIERVDDESKLSLFLNKFTLTMLEKIKQVINNKMCVSTFSVLLPIISLFRASKNSTENEIKQILELHDKNFTYTSCTKLINSLRASKSINMLNVILVPNNTLINTAYIDYIKNLSLVQTYNKNNSYIETDKINSYFNKYTMNQINHVIDQSVINQNSNFILLSTFFFYSYWKYSFPRHNTRPVKFIGLNSVHTVQMMAINNINLRYYEDNVNKIVELDYSDDKITMGIICPKGHNTLDLSHDQLNYYISQLSEENIDIVQIPKFKHQSKYKFDNMFKRMGCQYLFTNADLSDLTPSTESVYISDILHQCVIIVNETGVNKHSFNNKHNNNTKSNKIFIADHSFTYYIRYKPTNTILIIGCFC